MIYGSFRFFLVLVISLMESPEDFRPSWKICSQLTDTSFFSECIETTIGTGDQTKDGSYHG